jgi:hypothetical protein
MYKEFAVYFMMDGWEEESVWVEFCVFWKFWEF